MSTALQTTKEVLFSFKKDIVLSRKKGETDNDYLQRIKQKMFSPKKTLRRKHREDYQNRGQKDDIVEIIIEKILDIQSVTELTAYEYSRATVTAETLLGNILEEYLRENLSSQFLYVDGVVRNTDFIDRKLERRIQIKGTKGTCNSTTLKAAKDNRISIEYYVDKQRNFRFDALNETFNTTHLSYRKFKNFVVKYPVEE